ncbi:MAG: caspase family protein [Pseudomonadota bacterium]
MEYGKLQRSARNDGHTTRAWGLSHRAMGAAAMLSAALIAAAALIAPVQADNHTAVADAKVPAAKLAMLVANWEYRPALGRLQNPQNDTRKLAGALQRAGFELSPGGDGPVTNVSRESFRTAFDAYLKRVAAAGDDAVTLFYYSGHGVANEARENHLVTTEIVSPYDDTFWNTVYPLSRIIAELKRASPGGTHIVVFDACRNELQLPERIVELKGFGSIERDAIPPGMVVAFATAAGRTASDDGLYASVLADEIVRQNQRVTTLLTRVRERVRRQTGGAQHPWHLSQVSQPVALTPRVGDQVAGRDDLEFRAPPRPAFMFTRANTPVFDAPDAGSGLVAIRSAGAVHQGSPAQMSLLTSAAAPGETWVMIQTDWGQGFVRASDVQWEWQ